MNEKRTIDLPRVISVEHKKDITPFMGVKPKIATELHNFALKGLITAEGKFHLDPGGFKIEHPSVGVYKLIHNLGYTNTSINVSIVDPPGGVKLVEHHPMHFSVECYRDGALTDMDWMFSLMKTI